jgi:DNA-binding NarL/FixJ family response regulator
MGKIMSKVYVIEDQTVLRELVCRLIRDMRTFELVGDSGDGRDGLEDCLRLRPDLVIVDLMLPGLNGIEVVAKLKAQLPRCHLLVFSAYSTRDRIQAILKSGVEGIVHKNASIDELETGIRKVSAGESYMSSEIVAVMRDIMLNPEITDTLAGLTSREREVVQLIAEGCTTKEIAVRLGVSAKTADTHRTNVMHKLQIRDIAGITRFAIQHGMIEP